MRSRPTLDPYLRIFTLRFDDFFSLVEKLASFKKWGYRMFLKAWHKSRWHNHLITIAHFASHSPLDFPFLSSYRVAPASGRIDKDPILLETQRRPWEKTMKLFNGYKTIVPKFHDIYLLIDDNFYCKQLKKKKTRIWKHGGKAVFSIIHGNSQQVKCELWSCIVTHVSKIGKVLRDPGIGCAISIDGVNTLICNLNHFAGLSRHVIIIAVSASHCRSCTVNDPLK